MRSLRAWLYWWAKFLGDVNAIQRGPQAVSKRLARRAAGRLTGRLLGKLFR